MYHMIFIFDPEVRQAIQGVPKSVHRVRDAVEEAALKGCSGSPRREISDDTALIADRNVVDTWRFPAISFHGPDGALVKRETPNERGIVPVERAPHVAIDREFPRQVVRRAYGDARDISFLRVGASTDGGKGSISPSHYYEGVGRNRSDL